MSRNFSSDRPRSGGSYKGGRSFGRPQNNRRRNSGGGKFKKHFIDPSRFVQAAVKQEEVVYTPTHNFTDFAVDTRIHENLAAMKFVQPSPIQDQTIPVALEGKDVVGIANTGTGKTAAFAIPMVHRLATERGSQAIILAPTRELAQQIEQQVREIARGCKVFTALLIGGAAMGPQLKTLRMNPRVIIGTPGRVKDHIERGTLKLDRTNIVVLDEVDRMLDMGFVHDIREILGKTNENRQSLYFSATLDDRVKGIIDSFSADPVHISVKATETSTNVEQDVVRFPDRYAKLGLLHEILISDDSAKTIIFDDTQRSVESLSVELVSRGFSVDAIHGGKSQGQRQRVLRKFKENNIRILVATDVAARGLDVSDITHVINYSVPQTYDDYVHRIGRTGRAGRTGFALTFVQN